MIKNNKILIITIMFIIFIMSMSTVSFGAEVDVVEGGTITDNPIENPGYYKPGNILDEDAEALTSKVKPILGTISTIGIVTSVITLMILGIKYMVGSVSEKAEYKKSMIPYIIGVVLLISVSGIVSLIATITEEIF